MKVVIKEKEYDYISDYPKGWLFASGDPYKFPVEIDRYTCFVKRFEKKSPDAITGWDLLVQLKGKFDPNLPRIYDVVEVEENNKLIHYIFYEFLTGQTLEAAVNRNTEFALGRLTQDLFNAAAALHARHFWFSDFCEKNIFAEATGRFLLIDLDSVQPLAEVPNNNMYGDKQYWALVFKFYKEHLGYKNLKPADVNGAILNYLQIVFLILRLKLALTDKRYDYKSTELYDNLPILLLDTDSGFKELFEQALAENPTTNDSRTATAAQDLIMRCIVQNDQVPYQPTRRMPEIIAFKLSETQVEPDQSFSLSWEVLHTAQLALYRNGVLYKEIPPGTHTLELRENYDGRFKKVEYTLRATSSAGEQRSNPLTVSITEPVDIPESKPIFSQEDSVDKPIGRMTDEETRPLPQKEPVEPKPLKPILPDKPTEEPSISVFQADTTQVIGGQKIYLYWEVEYATQVELYRNNQLYSNVLAGQSSLDIKEEYDAATTAVTYYLVASNQNARTRSEVLSVTVIKPITPDPGKLRYIRLVVATLLLAVAGGLGVVAYGIFSPKAMKVYALPKKLIEGQTVIIRGENFPAETRLVRVLFNTVPGKVTVLTPNSLRVLVPKITGNPVRVAFVVEEDTVYVAPQVLVNKKRVTSPITPPPVQTLTNVKPKVDSTIKSKEEFKPDSTMPDRKLPKINYPGTLQAQTKTFKPKPTLPKTKPTIPKPTPSKPHVNTAPDDYSSGPPVDVYKLVTVKSNVIVNQRRDGTKNLQITVQNSSAYDLDNVRVEIEYQRKNGKLVTKETLDFANVRAHTSKTLTAPDNEKGKKVDFKIVAINSKQLY